MTLEEYNTEIQAITNKLAILRRGDPIAAMGSDGDNLRYQTFKELRVERNGLIRARNKKFGGGSQGFARVVEVI